MPLIRKFDTWGDFAANDNYKSEIMQRRARGGALCR